MRYIKVYLQKPWKYADNSYYLYLTKFSPKEIKFINSNEFKVMYKPKKIKLNDFLKKSIRWFVKIFMPFLPNVHLTIKKGYDIIHCTHCLSLNKVPWVADIEWVGQFWISGESKNCSSKIFVRKILKSKYCKKILAWTKWTKEEIIKEFPEIKNKIEVLYPAVPTKKIRKKYKNKIVLLFSARKFYFKGGLHALDVIDKLTKKYDNVYGIIVSDVPKEILEKYKKNKKVKIYNLLPQQKLFKEIYPKCDIFVYPSYTDTFGFGIIEAMSFGMPVVSVDGQSRKELIKNGKTGFVVKKPLKWDLRDLENLESLKDTIKQVEKKVELLIKSKHLREFMARNCIKEVENGRFSINKRNEKLKKIYKEIISNG
ncbi:MAG: glycosyltransferase family 4 protein [Candidatus Pacearchaeota archaeon]